jgi:2-oxoglutarate dehydrogenase E2 component (dihydrolipoamide succinyltransferase)
MEKIIIPNINNNETEAKLVTWLVEQGDYVKEGQLIATLETTKATYDVEATTSGYVKKIGVVSNKYDFGKSIGEIFSTLEEYNIDQSKNSEVEDDDASAIFITEPAKKIIELNNLSIESIKSLGLKVIKASDLDILLSSNSNNNVLEISERQQAISKTVSISKNTIPDAFLLKKINVSNLLIYLSKYSSENNILVGLTESIIFALSKIFISYPIFFGSMSSEKYIKLPNSANIGVTMDIGNGLFIPVIQDANMLTLKKISESMMIFRMKALRNNFNFSDLSNSNITISLNVDEDTVLVKPIIFPGQICMLSVGSVLKEAISLDNDKINFNQYLYLGLAYDHRVVNGYEANNFLTDLKKLLENPDFVNQK